MPPGIAIASREKVIARAALDRGSSLLAQSLAALDAALAIAPDDGELAVARAETLSAWGRGREARDAYLRAEALGMRTARLYAELAAAHAALGEYDSAISAAERAILAEPSELGWRHLMGTLQEATGNTLSAIRTFESVIAEDPTRLDSRIELCRSLVSIGDPARCVVEAQRVLEQYPGCAQAHALLGIAALLQDRPAEALECLIRAELTAGAGSDLEVFDQVAIALNKLGRTSECIDMLEQQLPRRPNLNAHLGYATALLAEGRLLDGWRQFEFRWFTGPLAGVRPNYGKPVWGGQDLRGKTMLVRAEQGFGDVFQMLRYLPLLKERGARILLQPIVEIESMYAELAGVDQVVEADLPLPPFDYWVHLMSLPRIFATTLATMPTEIPYLRVNPELSARWRERMGEDRTLRVGVAWAGSAKHSNDVNRSIPLATFRPVLHLPQIRFFGLHREALPSQHQRELASVNFVNLGPELRDFGDTAAIIEQLDLLIAVDTAVVHIGGALGKPVWLLLPEPADYRWLKEREDSPWYPTIRLFRQRRARDWERSSSA